MSQVTVQVKYITGLARAVIYYVIICDYKNLVPFWHKELWRPLAANTGFCDLLDVVAYGHNQL